MGWVNTAAAAPRLHVQTNQHPLRTVLKLGGLKEFREAQAERARFTAKLRRRRRVKKAAAYSKKWRKANAAHDRQRKADWRAANVEHVRAYYRRYDELTPGRRAYKAKKAREYRARDKAAMFHGERAA